MVVVDDTFGVAVQKSPDDMAISFVAEDLVGDVTDALSVAVIFDNEAALFEQLECLNEAVVQLNPVVFNHNLFDLGSDWKSVDMEDFSISIRGQI